MAYIEFRNIKKSYNVENLVLKDLNLEVNEGDLVTLLGPSGCGKSTLLRSLAGFESIDGGSIHINGQDVTHLPPGKRNIGMVFQQYSLFPNMNVAENIAFGLKMQKMAPATINEKVARIIELVDLSGKETHYPAQLSGGQKQRVALARAIVTEPKVLLLDEPLSAIDALLRKNLQKQIRRIQKAMHITTIFVTHDQDEAMLMSDVIHVMAAGKIEQSGTPTEIYTHPKTQFVASFIGNYNLLNGSDFEKLIQSKTQASQIAIRPEAIEYFKQQQLESEDHLYFKGTVVDETISGNILSYVIETEQGVQLRADHLYRTFNLLDKGERVFLKVEKRNILEF